VVAFHTVALRHLRLATAMVSRQVAIGHSRLMQVGGVEAAAPAAINAASMWHATHRRMARVVCSGLTIELSKMLLHVLCWPALHVSCGAALRRGSGQLPADILLHLKHGKAGITRAYIHGS
jgi:hypothetical protein